MTDDLQVDDPYFLAHGPNIGMIDVAGSELGFVAIGYLSGPDGIGFRVWFSANGVRWELLPADPALGSADLRAVAATPTGWIVVGTDREQENPQAVIWTSVDGRTWAPQADTRVFDLGRYPEPLNDGTDVFPPVAGIMDVAASGSTLVAVGASCDEHGSNCTGAIWTASSDGSWSRAPELGDVFASLDLVIALDPGFLAFGAEWDGLASHAIGFRSDDGRAWTPMTIDGAKRVPDYSLWTRIIAGAAVAGGVVLLDAAEPYLELYGSTDGQDWARIDSLPQIRGHSSVAAGMLGTRDGRIVLIGSDPSAQEQPFARVLLRASD